MASAATALVVLVSEAATLVGPLRDNYDASAATGMPASITVLYLDPRPALPFKMLARAVADCYPETPPYGSACSEIIPHHL